MEEYLLHHCVTSDVYKPADNEDHQASASFWQTSGRAECVVVQENRQAYGASRVILSAMLNLVLQSVKTKNVLLFTLESPQVGQGIGTSEKLTHVDYSADATNFQSSTSSKSQLLEKMVHDIESMEAKVELNGATSARPLVVVLDSLNVLLQQTSLQQVLLFLRRLRQHAVVGSVIARLNAGAESPGVAQALAAQATATILVETRSSLRSYPLLATERRREIPKEMHGFVLFVRQKKNGRSSESIEYFQVQSDTVQFVAAGDVDGHCASADSAPTAKDATTQSTPSGRKSELGRTSQPDAKPTSPTSTLQFESSDQPPLPVRQEEMSFNLSISAAEQRAKSQVQLPYMHQGLTGVSSGSSSNDGDNKSRVTADAAGSNTLFFIDEDDPDWDDDDLDDDLDI
ncbi:Elongator subunit Iki1 [Phytophthora infestans]|uniref:Elongator complex protein 5 n=1 Tax=Phytophthora infestans TaxID=4787 RepID=A0A833S1G2_PHYIN|nr:Elongator subunit Iki1 [Phytophthora infestans]KAF4150211.1 Elongator subunit Iki1 [Phytophthora infestans]